MPVAGAVHSIRSGHQPRVPMTPTAGVALRERGHNEDLEVGVAVAVRGLGLWAEINDNGSALVSIRTHPQRQPRELRFFVNTKK